MEEAVSKRRKAFAAAYRSDEDRQAYISASRRASSVIAKAKAEISRATCSSLTPKSDPKFVYNLLRSVADSYSSSSSFPNFPNLQPRLLPFNSRLRFNSTPTFLGVTFYRTLSFSKHISSLKAKSFPRLKALRCISASSWGPSKESLSVLYNAFLRLLLTYATPTWFPF